ncbi:hypothetical protein BDN72DRAFT_436672 [Pluteus cervinus]|uniref:Uncharacterized protein n=1 Tax=Pluteus cervinus TaxID=181527 RepID=A0ACD3B0S9_9AGAR|nr:hypothetical protein BDN72DRAFT_436672 [Pluteus cervinus]
MAFNTQLSLSSTSSTASIYSSSLQFNSPTADIVFLSSDGVTFHLHSKNLEPTTGALPGIALPTKDPDEPVQLIETAETLAILFQYSYPQRHPELSGMEFDVIAPLAEAVEKYKVFPAQKACCMVMKSYLYERPAEVLAYAGKYKYTELADEAAPLLLTMPIEAIVKVLPPTLVVSWVCVTLFQSARITVVSLTT